MSFATIGGILGSGWVLGYVSKIIVGWLKKVEPQIAPQVKYMIKLLETKFNIDIPDGLEDFVINSVNASIKAADMIVCDPVFIRNVCRAIIAKDPSKLAEVTKVLLNIDWAGNIKAQLPEDIKDAVNAAQEDHSVKLITAQMSKVLPTEKIPEETKLREYVKVVVQANKVDKEVIPMRSVEVQNMVEALRAKVLSESPAVESK